MRINRSSVVLPLPVKRALRKLGQNIKDARRRRIPVSIAAERASVNKPTQLNIEKSDSVVAIGLYTTVLFVMGTVERLADIADVRDNAVGHQLEEEQLRQRICVASKPKHMKGK